MRYNINGKVRESYMSKGKTKSRYSITERKEIAFDLFGRGFKNAEVARKIGVTPETTSAYRKEYELIAEERAMSDPNYLNNILQHTRDRITQLETIIKEGWNTLEGAGKPSDRVSVLRALKDTTMDIAKLQRLTDVRIEVINKTERAERIQGIMLKILNDVVRECPTCRVRLSEQLRDLQQAQLTEAPRQIEAKVVN